MDQSQKKPPLVSSQVTAIIFVLVACFSSAMMAFMVKLIHLESELPNQIVVFIRFFVSFFLLLIPLFFFKKKQPLKEKLKIQILTPYLVRTSFGILTIYAYFYAISKIDLVNAVLFIYTSPLFIPFVLWVWKGVPIHSRLWIGIIAGFFGVFLIVQPKFNNLNVGYLIALITGLTAAISYVAARLQSRTEKNICINFYFFLSCTIITFIFCAKTFFLIAPQITPKIWLYLISMGFFGTLYQTLIVLAFRYGNIQSLGAFLYFSVGFAMLLDWLAFNKTISIVNLFGLLLIILGAITVTVLDPMRRKSIENKTDIEL